MNKKTLLATAITLTLGTGAAQAASWTGTFTAYGPAGTLLHVDTAVTGEELVSLSSPVPFFGFVWLVQDLTIYGEGTHSIDTFEDEVYTVDVGAEQVMGDLTFVFKGNYLSTVVNVWDVTVVDGKRYYTSTDWDGDGIQGGKMIDGALPGFSVYFDMVAPVPVPAAVWLFGSGLLGLMGLAHRKKKA